jgi:hypothetical protein
MSQTKLAPVKLFDDYTGVDDCNHDLPAVREARI